MSEYSLSSRFIYRVRLKVDQYSKIFSQTVGYRMSRDNAHRLRRRLIKTKGKKVVDKELKKRIQNYCKKTFGNKSYWPWLALYTEIRGEFIKGWIPYDYYRFEILPKLNPINYQKLSESKVFDYRLFGNKVIAPLFSRIRGVYFGTEGNFINKSLLVSRLQNMEEELVIKPEDGKGGNGILFIKSNEINLDKLPLKNGTNLVFQTVFRQHKYLSELNPESVNTFRVMTHMNLNGDVLVKFVALRFGLKGMRIDNGTNGGGWVSVNEDGEVAQLAYTDYWKEVGIVHPDTGFCFSELNLSFYSKIVALCEKTHKKFPFVAIIGWDIVVDETGTPYILEWNANNPMFWGIEARVGPIWNSEELEYMFN